MLKHIFGKKIGMTQIFTSDRTVVPATAIDVSNWIIVGSNKAEKSGYDALKVACLRDRYAKNEFSAEWLKSPKKYFLYTREIKLDAPYEDFEVGKSINFASLIESGADVHVSGLTKGKGFAGVVKRYGFRGGPASHGGKLGRKPGSLGGARMQGHVPKGKRMPGHMGAKQQMMRNLSVAHIDQDNQVILVKGSIPGHSGSFVVVEKA
jgi:large subunit ribosomal protein L3